MTIHYSILTTPFPGLIKVMEDKLISHYLGDITKQMLTDPEKLYAWQATKAIEILLQEWM